MDFDIPRIGEDTDVNNDNNNNSVNEFITKHGALVLKEKITDSMYIAFLGHSGCNEDNYVFKKDFLDLDGIERTLYYYNTAKYYKKQNYIDTCCYEDFTCVLLLENGRWEIKHPFKYVHRTDFGAVVLNSLGDNEIYIVQNKDGIIKLNDYGSIKCSYNNRFIITVNEKSVAFDCNENLRALFKVENGTLEFENKPLGDLLVTDNYFNLDSCEPNDKMCMQKLAELIYTENSLSKNCTDVGDKFYFSFNLTSDNICYKFLLDMKPLCEDTKELKYIKHRGKTYSIKCLFRSSYNSILINVEGTENY